MKKLLAPIVGIIALLVFTATLPAEITLQLEPPVQDAEEFATLDIIVGNSGELGPLTGIALTIRYDPAMIVAVDAAYGNYLDLGNLGSDKALIDLANEPPGLVHFIENSRESRTDLENAQPSSFSVATVTFRKVVPGTSRVIIFYPYLGFGDNFAMPLSAPATIHFEGVTPFLSILCPPDLIVPCVNAAPPPDFAGGVVSDPFDPNPQVSHVGDDIVRRDPIIQIFRTYRVTSASGPSEECTQKISILPQSIPGDYNGDCIVDRVWDLKADWSDTRNPNGVWSYLFENAIASGGTRGWDVFASPPGPPHIWGLNDFYPGWSQSNGGEAVLDASGSIRDVQPGDIYAHSWNQGPVAVAWTSPIAGHLDVSGGIWPVRDDIGRSNRFELTLNGAIRAAGIVGAGDPYDRAHPRAFTFSADVQAGDVVLFSVRPYFTVDDYFGLNLRIEIPDLNAPAIACPPGLTVPCLNAVPPPDFAGGTVSDPSDPNPQVSHVRDETLALNPVQILRTYRAVNATGLARECTQTITVAATAGDLNADCLLDRADLDLLLTQIRQHSTDSRYDLNGDGKVDIADARYLILHSTAQ